MQYYVPALLFLLPSALGLGVSPDKSVVHLYAHGTPGLEEAFAKAYDQLNQTFDYKTYNNFEHQLEKGVQAYKGSKAFKSYAYFPTAPHCDKGEVSPVATKAVTVSGISAFPGGAVKKLFGFDFAKAMFGLSQAAQGPAAAGLVPAMGAATTALGVGAGLVQAAISGVISVVPPLIPPPAWINQPLSCVPMITGHNCFGAVLYPITMADFVIADVTDSMLDGYVAGFPNTYATKVGKTSDEAYKTCFASVMSMMCSSLFPRCTLPMSRDEPAPVGGRVPMCLHLCILPLAMCPGMWIGDLQGSCSMVSVPPMCTQAFYWNLARLPPQYTSFDEANPFPADCPATEADAAEDLSLFDEAVLPPSPITLAAAALAA